MRVASRVIALVAINLLTVSAQTTTATLANQLNITVWTGPNCTGNNAEAIFEDTNTLGPNNTIISIASSFNVSSGGLQGQQQLDFSRSSSDPTDVGTLPNVCNFFVKTFFPNTLPSGCVDASEFPFQCLRVWINEGLAT